MRSTCVRLDVDLDPFEIGARSGMLWAREGLTIAGIGEAARIAVDRPAGAAAAQAALGELAGDDELQRPGAGVVALAALPFDRRRSGELVVPQVVVARSRQGQRWLTATGIEPAEAIEIATALLGDGASKPQPTSFDLESVVAPEFWRDSVLAPVRDRVRNGELNKVVLARELVLRTDHPIDVAEVTRRLQRNFGSTMVFAVDGFVGASPELLVSRADDIVRAHPLAGTAPRSSDPATDARSAASLAASEKDHIEHRITIDWLLDNLLPFCSYVDAEPEPTIISLANVHHLGTRVEGRLSTPAASILELVAALHPTPALGGDPQGPALDIIDAAEPGDRGNYGGPVGWVDGAGNGEFAVGLRCGQIDGTEARIWAGVGVVADSEPQAELEETRAKFRAMLGALISP